MKISSSNLNLDIELIMKHNNIDILNRKLISSMNDKSPIGLSNGKMGMCIYFYYLSRWEEQEEYKQIAEKLLDDIVFDLSETNDISKMTDITVEYGLTGIAIGISHLVKENFVKGDINEILEDIDSNIFKKLAFLSNEESKDQIPKVALIQILCYLYLRYTEQTSPGGKYIFQELIIKIIELFKNNLQFSFFKEQFSFSVQNFHLPLFLYIFSKIYDLNIYNGRIIRILDEFANQVLSSIPVLHANRLYLLWGLLCIKPCMIDHQKEMESHINLLKKQIDIGRIIHTELKNQDIYLMDGLPLVYIILYSIRNKYPEYGIKFNPQLFYNKIKKSEAWNVLLNKEPYFYRYQGLFNGFTGANLVLSHIKKNYP